MLKIVENILKRHLHDAAEEYEREVEMTIISPFEILWRSADYSERVSLARELITAIRGVDLSQMRQIPSLEEAEKFLQRIIPVEHLDDYDFNYHARKLIAWLEYRK